MILKYARRQNGLKILGFVLFFCSESLVFANNQNGIRPDKMMEKIIELRAEIEALQQELTTKKEANSSEISSLVLRKAELESEITSTEKVNLGLRKEIDELNGELANSGGAVSELLPVFVSSCNDLKGQIEKGFPYKKIERLKSLSEICLEKVLSKQDPLNTTLVYKLWTFVEDEIRIRDEVSLVTTNIEFDGQKYLAETVIVGTYAWYAKTPSDVYLVFDSTNDAFRTASSKEESAIRNLIVGLKRGVRTGPYALPAGQNLVDKIY